MGGGEPADGGGRRGPVDLRLALEASGPVPADRAWERYDRLDLWPTWSPQLRSVETGDARDTGATEDRRLVAGLTGRVRGPLGLWAHFTVLDVDRDARRWSWAVRRGPVGLHLDHGVEPRSAGDRPEQPGSRTWLVVRGPAPLVAGYAPAAWYALHRLVTLPG